MTNRLRVRVAKAANAPVTPCPKVIQVLSCRVPAWQQQTCSGDRERTGKRAHPLSLSFSLSRSLSSIISSVDLAAAPSISAVVFTVAFSASSHTHSSQVFFFILVAVCRLLNASLRHCCAFQTEARGTRRGTRQWNRANVTDPISVHSAASLKVKIASTIRSAPRP